MKNDKSLHMEGTIKPMETQEDFEREGGEDRTSDFEFRDAKARMHEIIDQEYEYVIARAKQLRDFKKGVLRDYDLVFSPEIVSLIFSCEV